MRLQTKQAVDWYLGRALAAFLKPLAWLAGHVLRRDHALEVRGTVAFLKLLGGGNLVGAAPTFLGLKQRYPDLALTLVTTSTVAPFARTLGVFDRIDEVDDRNALALVASGLRVLWRNLRVDTIVDLEVYSRLATVFATLTLARNRIAYYVDSATWRRYLDTHLMYYNRYAGRWIWYDAVARLLGAQPATMAACRERMLETLGAKLAPVAGRVAIGHATSELVRERELTVAQWKQALQSELPPGAREVLILGGRADVASGETLREALAAALPGVHVENLCGTLALDDSIRKLATCSHFFGVDSALLHYARLLGLPCRSYWGPTDPSLVLRPVEGQDDVARYRKVPCSPCVHVAEEPPCHGRNICIDAIFSGESHATQFWLDGARP